MRFNRGRIIRVVFAVICLLVMTGPPAAAFTCDFIYLAPGGGWTTNPDINRYPLGVSNDPGGTLIPLDSSGRLNPLLVENHVYYLYAGNLPNIYFPGGSNIQMVIYTDYIGLGGASPLIDARFNVVGSPAAFQLWTPTFTTPSGFPQIYLGWAEGIADKVTTDSFSPGGGNDYYLVLGIGVQPTPPSVVPIPGAMLLFGTGLAGLVGIGRWRRKK